MNVWFTLLIGLFVLPCFATADEPIWLEIDDVVYGAKPDERGPIGGGDGYANIVTGGDYAVKDLDALLDALSEATEGQVVFIPGETDIDLTAQMAPSEVRGLILAS